MKTLVDDEDANNVCNMLITMPCTMLSMPTIYVRCTQSDYEKMLALKEGKTWLDIMKRGLEMKGRYPNRSEVQSMIDESIEKAKHGGY
jgi:hypothetical protein